MVLLRMLLSVPAPIRHGLTTVTSYWAPWRLKSPVSPLFAQQLVQAQIKENIKAQRHWPLRGIHLWPGIRCSAIEVFKCFMGMITPIWIIYPVRPFWNMIPEIYFALNSRNFRPSHEASGPFVTLVLSYGISCHIRWRTKKTWMC